MDIAEKTMQLKQDIDDAYKAGKQKEWSDFWDDYQNNGKRVNYYYAFAGWEVPYIRPKYKVTPEGIGMFSSDRAHQFMFYNNKTFKKIESKYFDFSKMSNLSQTNQGTGNRQIFYYCSNLEEMEDIGMPAAYYYRTWDYCTKLHTIAVVRSEETTGYELSFNNCVSLKNITFEGIIGRSISFSSSPLTVESMKSIITHLKDYSGDTTNAGKYTLTLKDSCKTLMAEQGAIEELGGKTYDQYITDIGWNLA